MAKLDKDDYNTICRSLLESLKPVLEDVARREVQKVVNEIPWRVREELTHAINSDVRKLMRDKLERAITVTVDLKGG